MGMDIMKYEDINKIFEQVYNRNNAEAEITELRFQIRRQKSIRDGCKKSIEELMAL